jgi:phytoene desaturase
LLSVDWKKIPYTAIIIQMAHKSAIIIGAGFGGLATAALLAKKGYTVTLLEKNDHPGGRAMVYKEKGFTFDMGPSWYLMPEAFERYFSLFDTKPSDFYTLKRLDPQYRVYFDKDDRVDMYRDLQKNLDTFDSIAPGAGKLVEEYLDLAKYQYDIAMNQFIYKNYNSLLDIMDPRLMIEGTKLKLFSSLNAFVSQYTNQDKIKKILQYTMVFLGGSPSNTPAFYSIMSHIDFHLGVFYPMGGMGKVIEGLAKLCKENRVKIVTNQEVKRIHVRNKHAHSVETQDKTYEADLVISNADYPHTETDLLTSHNQTYSKEYWERKTIAPSAFLLYLGVKGTVKNLSHHTLSFADDWEHHFAQIFDDPAWPDKPSYYVCCPSKTDPSVAPKGHENIFVLVPVAAGLKDTKDVRMKFRSKIISHIEHITGEKIDNRIVVERIFSQQDYASMYNAYKGTALGLAHTLFQTALFRPQNKSKNVDNLYYVGQFTHPGIGVPMCLISAELTTERIVNEQR